MLSFFLAAVLASTSAKPAPSPTTEEDLPSRGVTPLESPQSDRPGSPSDLLPDGESPLERPQSDRPGSPPSDLLPDGESPLEGPRPAHSTAPASPMPADGVDPLDHMKPTATPTLALPLGMGPQLERPPPLDPKATSLVRVDAMVGSVWRIREADPIIATSVEWGRMHGFSAAFHTEMMVVTDRDFVRALDFPVGVGAIARGRLRNRPLYGSVGLSAGVLVHRAGRDEGVIRRLDPDFRIPIRLAWTVGRIGASLAFVAGYSVRNRIYERRGSPVLERRAIRVGLVLGLHWDIKVRSVVTRRRDR